MFFNNDEILKQVHADWDVSPRYVADPAAPRLTTLTDNKRAGFIPEKEFCFGTEGIHVNLLWMTDLEDFARPLAYMVNATLGGAPPEEKIKAISDEIYEGGLQHALEKIVIIFEISGISRATTHQIVRHRKWGFHQQSLRWAYLEPKNIGFRLSPYLKHSNCLEAVKEHLRMAKMLYSSMAHENIPFQDCRDILPISTQTYIIAETTLKDLIDSYTFRACSFCQQQIIFCFEGMKRGVLERYPGLEKYLRTGCEKTGVCQHQGWEDADLKKACSCGAETKAFKTGIYK